MTVCVLNTRVFVCSSKSQAAQFRQMINDSHSSPPGHYSPSYALEEGTGVSQVMVMGPDDFIVSVTR